jgi:hypothetical protein
MFKEPQESIPPTYINRAGIFKQSRRARNRVGIGFSYQPPCYIGWRNSFLEIDS